MRNAKPGNHLKALSNKLPFHNIFHSRHGCDLSLSHAQIVDLEARTQFINQLQLFARQSAQVNHGTEHLSF